MAAPACVGSSWRSAISEGDAEYWGVHFRPPMKALLDPAPRPKQLAIASAHKCEAALYKATGSAAQIVCFPATIGYARLAKQSFCDAAISRAGEIRGDRAKGCAQSFTPLFGNAMKRRSWRVYVHPAP